jgi:hypothetical protein
MAICCLAGKSSSWKIRVRLLGLSPGSTPCCVRRRGSGAPTALAWIPPFWVPWTLWRPGPVVAWSLAPSNGSLSDGLSPLRQLVGKGGSQPGWTSGVWSLRQAAGGSPGAPASAALSIEAPRSVFGHRPACAAGLGGAVGSLGPAAAQIHCAARAPCP